MAPRAPLQCASTPGGSLPLSPEARSSTLLRSVGRTSSRDPFALPFLPGKRGVWGAKRSSKLVHLPLQYIGLVQVGCLLAAETSCAHVPTHL